MSYLLLDADGVSRVVGLVKGYGWEVFPFGPATSNALRMGGFPMIPALLQILDDGEVS